MARVAAHRVPAPSRTALIAMSVFGLPAGANAQPPATAELDSPRLSPRNEALNDADVDVRRTAVQSLGRVGDAGGVPGLIKATADEEIRAGIAVVALGRIGPIAKAAVPALVKVLDDKDADLRAATALALGRIGPGAADAKPR